jgi:hypothetical protein
VLEVVQPAYRVLCTVNEFTPIQMLQQSVTKNFSKITQSVGRII